MTRFYGKVLAGLAMVIFSCSISLGQTTFGAITGTVTDASGAVVPGVEVTLTNLGTNAKQTIKTGPDGIYEFVNVLPGNYRIDAEMAGFMHFSRSPVVVQVQQRYKINIQMEVGAVSQTIEVKAATPLLQPQSSSLGQVIAGRSVSEMPLNGRNVFNLMGLVPSVVPQGQSEGTPTGTNPFAWGNYQVNGAFGNQSAMYLDGIPMNNGYINLPNFVPTQDSIQEFKVQTDNLGPEWGRFAGGVMNLTTKGGTNQIHGEAYEFLRNKVLNSNDFFDNRAGIPLPAFTQNQFGGNVGGPLYIPGVYDGRDKTFWFFSWEGFRLRQGQPFALNVPTVAERAGDFSNLRDSSGSVIPIYNPLTVCGQLGNPACAVGSNGQPVYTRQQFPGNIIPSAMINPTSAKLMNLWPLPNTTGQPFTNLDDWVGNASVGGNNDELVTRIDQNVSDKQHIFGRYSNWTNLNLPINPFGNGVCQDRCTETFTTNDIVLDDTYSFSPTLVTDIHVGFDRFAYNRSVPSSGFDLASIGWPSILNSEIPSSLRTFPTPVVQEASSSLFGTQGAGSVIISRDNSWNVSGDLTKILGRHTLKSGGQFLVLQHNYAQTNDASGLFSFDRGYTANSPFNPVGGFGFASYLLGYPSSGGNSLPALVAAQQIYRGVYFGDTWQATNKLTLNLGLRYEQDGPWSERFNRLSFWDLTAASPLAQATGLPLKGEVGLVDSPLLPSRNNINLDTLQFAPRVGFAEQLTPNTVLRGGYGIFWIPNDVNFGTSPNVDFLNSIGTPFVASINGGITPFGNFGNPFPNGVLQPPGRAPNVNQLAENAGGVNAPVPSDQQGYMQQWNFDIQRQLPKGFFVDMAYAGSKGTHLQGFSQYLNQLPDNYLSLGTALDNQVANPFFGLIQSGPLSTPTVAKSQLLLPYPEFSNVSNTGSGFGDSIYHSFQFKIQRQFSSGGTILVAYTASKLISDVDTLTSWLEGSTGGVAGVIDWNNIKGSSYSLSSQDVPQRMVISYVQNLPVGRGQRFLSNAHGVVGELISGWGMDGITTFQSGFPLKIGASGGGMQPNRTCTNASLPGSVESRVNEWFNTSCFSLSPSFTYGDESRVDPTLRQQGINNFDFALFKNIEFGPGEKYDVQFRTEVFNLFNTPEFGPPGTTVGLSTFGVVSSQVNNPRLIQFALKFMF
jgi:hypothetical protein